MTPFETHQIDQERCEQQNAIAQELYYDGAADGTILASPSSRDSAYLDGYFATLRQMVEQSEWVFYPCFKSPPPDKSQEGQKYSWPQGDEF